MDALYTKERYQEVVNNEGAVFFVESSDNVKFHVFDKKTQELIGKAEGIVSDAELSKKVAEIITFN